MVDVQTGWLEMSEGLKESVGKHIGHMRGFVSLFRKAGAPIIFTYHSFPEKGIAQGSKEFDLFSNFTPEAQDGKVVKTRQNAFNNTELERLVREKGCDTVILIGLSALHCVLSTYYGAYDKDLQPYLGRGAVAGPDEESIQIAEKICDTLSLRAVSQILDQDPRLTSMG